MRSGLWVIAIILSSHVDVYIPFPVFVAMLFVMSSFLVMDVVDHFTKGKG